MYGMGQQYGDDGDGVQYDTFYAPSAYQLEADAIRRECLAERAPFKCPEHGGALEACEPIHELRYRVITGAPEEPITAPLADSAFNRRMADGHYRRTGHEYRAHLANPVGGIWQLVRECCE